MLFSLFLVFCVSAKAQDKTSTDDWGKLVPVMIAKLEEMKVPINTEYAYLLFPADLACTICTENLVNFIKREPAGKSILLYYTVSKQKIQLKTTPFKDVVQPNNFYVIHASEPYDALSKNLQDPKGPFFFNFKAKNKINMMYTMSAK
jgi:hypothetical protein